MHRIDGDENRWITQNRGRNRTHGGLRVPMMVHVGIVQHDLPPPAQLRPTICFTLDEEIDDAAL
jgi:hypothetical protein